MGGGQASGQSAPAPGNELPSFSSSVSVGNPLTSAVSDFTSPRLTLLFRSRTRRLAWGQGRTLLTLVATLSFSLSAKGCASEDASSPEAVGGAAGVTGGVAGSGTGGSGPVGSHTVL